MFCPECKAEFVKGITECPECHVPLVDVLPAEAKEEPGIHEPDLVTVLETSDRMLILMAKSILDGEGIRYVLVGDRMQEILGFGGSGLTARVARVKIQVAKEDEADALVLLEGIGRQPSDDR